MLESMRTFLRVISNTNGAVKKVSKRKIAEVRKLQRFFGIINMQLTNNTNNNYTIRQMKLPLEIEKIIDIACSVTIDVRPKRGRKKRMSSLE